MNPNDFQKRAIRQIMNDIINVSPERARIKQQLQPAPYWKEVGATVITAPRQSGKTTLTHQLLDIFGASIVTMVTHKNRLENLSGLQNGRILIFDEYDLVEREALNKILSAADWKHVILIGSLR